MRVKSLELPEPSAKESSRSRRLADRVRAEIEAAGGWIRFDRYMQLVLYEPQLGYYSGPNVKFGAYGDFVTAPELGDFLAAALAERIAPALESLADPLILELGAGTGRMARQLIEALQSRRSRSFRYRILETSGDLRARQQIELAAAGTRVAWLDTLPDQPFQGLILANEVADALPAARFVKQGGEARPLGVRTDREGFAWAIGAPDAELAAAVAAIERELPAPLPEGYRSELSPLLPGWLAALSGVLASGHMLLVDYGLVRREYFHESRSDGTLICHYRHRAHANPFLYPGLQDISAWVDFSACAAAAREAGFVIGGFTTQAQFLLSAMAEAARPLDSPARLAALKTLILPGEMGERFKIMLLTKNRASFELGGRDFRNWL